MAALILHHRLIQSSISKTFSTLLLSFSAFEPTTGIVRNLTKKSKFWLKKKGFVAIAILLRNAENTCVCHAALHWYLLEWFLFGFYRHLDLHQSKLTPPSPSITRESLFIQSDRQQASRELRNLAPESRRKAEFAANNTSSAVIDTTSTMGIKELELISKTIKRKLNNKFKITFSNSNEYLCKLKAKVGFWIKALRVFLIILKRCTFCATKSMSDIHIKLRFIVLWSISTMITFLHILLAATLNIYHEPN